MTSTDLEIVANYTVFQPVAKIKTDPEFGNIQPPTCCCLLPVINFVFSKLEFSLITSGTQVYRGKPSPPTTPPPERLLPRCRREIKLMLTRLLRPHQRLSGNHFFLSVLSRVLSCLGSQGTRETLLKRNTGCKEKFFRFIESL